MSLCWWFWAVVRRPARAIFASWVNAASLRTFGSKARDFSGLLTTTCSSHGLNKKDGIPQRGSSFAVPGHGGGSLGGWAPTECVALMSEQRTTPNGDLQKQSRCCELRTALPRELRPAGTHHGAEEAECAKIQVEHGCVGEVGGAPFGLAPENEGQSNQPIAGCALLHGTQSSFRPSPNGPPFLSRTKPVACAQGGLKQVGREGRCMCRRSN